MDVHNAPTLVRAAYVEQKTLQLSWFKSVAGFLEVCGSAAPTEGNFAPYSMPLFDSTSRIRLNASTIFNSIWDSERICKKKLGFYNSVKHQFELEPYSRLLATDSVKELLN